MKRNFAIITIGDSRLNCHVTIDGIIGSDSDTESTISIQSD
ncbi:MAG: hypothetical protein ACLUD0_05850 [Eubacterium ramulus]